MENQSFDNLSFEQVNNPNYMDFFEKQLKHDDLRILDRHIEYAKNKDEIAYLTYLLAKNEDNGDFGYCVKVVKLCKLVNVPKELREKKALLVLMDELLSAVWHKQINFINIYANIVKEDVDKLGFLYCYGLQETEVIQEETSYYSKYATKEEKISATLKKLKKQADINYEGLIRLFRGTFRQSKLKPLSIEEGEAIRECIENGKYIQVLRGIPKTHISSASGVTNSVNGITTTPDGVEQNEEFIRALLHDHYSLVNMAFPIPLESILTWSNITAQDLALYKSQYTGSKGYNTGISIPFMFANNASQTMGNTEGFTDTSSHNTGIAQGLSDNYSHNVGENQGVSHNVGYSRGENLGIADSISQGNSHTISNGLSNSQSLTNSHGTSNTISDGVTQGITESTGIAKSHSVSQSEGFAESRSVSDSISHSVGTSHSVGNTIGETNGTTTSHSQGITDTTGITRGVTNTHGITDSTGNSQTNTHGTSSSVANGTTATQGQTISDAISHTDGKTHSDTISNTQGTTTTNGYGANSSTGGSIGHNEGNTLGVGGNVSFIVGANGQISSTETDSVSKTYNQGSSQQHSTANSNSTSVGSSDSTSVSDGRTHSVSNSNSISKSATFSNGISDSISNGTSTGRSISNSNSESLSHSNSRSLSNTIGNSISHSLSNSHSVTDGNSVSDSVGQTTSRGVTHSLGRSISDGITESSSTSKSNSVSHSVSKGISDSQSLGSSSGVSKSLSDGISTSLGKTSSRGISESLSDGQGVSKGVSVSDGRGQGISKTNSEGLGNSQGISNAISNATGLGQGMNFSFGPSIGYSRSFNTFDEEKNLLIKLLEEMNERAILATTTGLFYVDSYVITHQEETKAGVSLAARSSWGGNTKLGTVQVIEPDPYTSEHLLKHVSVFEPCTMKDNTPRVIDNYIWSTALLTSELAALTHLPRVEAAGLSTVANNIPPFSVIVPKRGEFYLGKQINYEDGIPFHDYYFSKKEFMHTLICGTSGTGKTTTATRIAREIIQKDSEMKILALDWKSSWRVLQRFTKNNDEFDFYSLDPQGINTIKTNLYVPPKYISIMQWRDKVNVSLCVGFGLGNKMLGLLNQVTDYLFKIKGVIIRDENGIRESDDARDKIYDVTLADVYQMILILRSGSKSIPEELKTTGKGMADAYDSILTKLDPFYSGALKDLYCCTDKEKCVLPNDLINGKRVMVIEGGELHDDVKIAVLSILSWGFFLYSKARKIYERVVEKRFFILEEAHRVLVNRKDNPQPLQIAEDIFEIMFNESREFGIYIMPIVQHPSHLPPNITANCSILIVHKLGDADDLSAIVTQLARNARLDNRDVPIWITQQPRGQAIVRLNNTDTHLEADPVLVQIAYCEAEPPDLEQLVDILNIEIPHSIKNSIDKDDIMSYEEIENKFFN